MAELVGNVLVGQSGGPTSVINASVAGLIAEALNHECIEEIYGTLNGVLGILHDVTEQRRQADGAEAGPAAAKQLAARQGGGGTRIRRGHARTVSRNR